MSIDIATVYDNTIFIRMSYHIHAFERTQLVKINRQGISWRYNWIQTRSLLLLGEHILTIFLCIKRVRLNWKEYATIIYNNGLHDPVAIPD